MYKIQIQLKMFLSLTIFLKFLSNSHRESFESYKSLWRHMEIRR